MWQLSQNCGCVSLHSRLNSVKESSRFRVSSGRTLQIRATIRTWCRFSVVERSRCPFASAMPFRFRWATRLLSLPLGADGGWWRRSGGRDGVGPSRLRLVMLTPSRCLLVVVGASVLLCLSIVVSHSCCVSVSLGLSIAVSQYRCVSVSLCLSIVVSQYRCVSVSL